MEIHVYQEPFPHIHFSDVLPTSINNKILSELTNSSSWLRVVKNLYEVDVLEQISSSNVNYRKPEIISLLNIVYKQVYSDLSILLERKARLHIHRFAPGTGISLHTDSDEEGGRLILFFNSTLQSSLGGELFLVNSLSEKTKLIYPTNNTAIFLPTSYSWFHAVTEQLEGIRYSMVFQLFKKVY